MDKIYYLQFDTNKLPLDFENWIKLDIQQDDLKKKIHGDDNCIFLNEYYYVVIEAKNDFYMYFGGMKYELEKGTKYIPRFPLYHDIFIEITPEINIYIEPNMYNHVKVQKILYDHNYKPYNELLSLLNVYPYMYCNLNIVSGYYINYDLVVDCEMSGSVPKKEKKNISEEEFYLDIEKQNLNYPIHLYDKYIQYEFIKIYKFNN